MIEIENENCTIIIVRPTTGGPKRRQLVAVQNCREGDGATWPALTSRARVRSRHVSNGQVMADPPSAFKRCTSRANDCLCPKSAEGNQPTRR